MKAPDRMAEPAALRELMKVLKLRPPEAAKILGVKEGDVARWMTGQALIPGDPRTAWADIACRLVDAVQGTPVVVSPRGAHADHA